MAIQVTSTTFLNGVCRHELVISLLLCFDHFLNGVCRHEQHYSDHGPLFFFLNGVCRHELSSVLIICGILFLNGVCRHEQQSLFEQWFCIFLNGVCRHERATASTFLYEKGYEEDWIELQLAHADENKTKASYNHAKHLENRRKMLQDWADIVDSWRN